MVFGAEERIEGHVVDGVVHEAHVPFQAEAQAADIRRCRDEREGRGFLRDGHRPGIAGQDDRVHLAQEVDRLQVDVAAVTVRRILAVAPAVVQIQHARHRVHADAVNVILFKKQAGGGNQKALDLIAAEVKDHGAPVGMLGHALFLALVKGGAVEHPKTVLVARKVRRDPVHDDPDAGPVQSVDKIAEIVRRAVTRGRRIVAGDLIPPGAVIGILRHGHQFDMCISHVAAVGGEFLRHAAVVETAAGQFPGAEVHLINAHGFAQEAPMGTPLHETAVLPLIFAVVPDDGGRLRSVLVELGAGVCLHHGPAVCAVNPVFVMVAVPGVTAEGYPYPALFVLHRLGVPAVEVTGQADASRVRRPDDKAEFLQLINPVAAETVPGHLGFADVEKINIVSRDKFAVSLIHRWFSLLIVF